MSTSTVDASANIAYVFTTHLKQIIPREITSSPGSLITNSGEQFSLQWKVKLL
jgi:hypothetical protein